MHPQLKGLHFFFDVGKETCTTEMMSYRVPFSRRRVRKTHKGRDYERTRPTTAQETLAFGQQIISKPSDDAHLTVFVSVVLPLQQDVVSEKPSKTQRHFSSRATNYR